MNHINIFHQFAVTFMAFFAIMNPISSLPVYLSLTASDSPELSRQVARKALLIAFAIVAIFALSGQFLFTLFGISLPALRIAGGCLVFLIGFHMLQGNNSAHQHSNTNNNTDSEQAMNLAISPLATPLLAGPGVIATAMSLSAHHTVSSILTTISAFALLCLLTYYLLINGNRIVQLLGDNLMQIITKMMGLILAVIGTQMLIVGLKSAFHW